MVIFQYASWTRHRPRMPTASGSEITSSIHPAIFVWGGGTANTLASHLERSNAPGVRVMHAVYIHHPFQTAQFYTLLEGSKTIWRATAFFMIFRNLLVLLCLFSLLEESQPAPNSYP